MKRGEILLYGPVGVNFGGQSASDFQRQLQALGHVDEVNLRINSEGGDVFDGRAIYTSLVRHKARVTVDVDGLAGSIASLVAMAADKGQLRMAEGSMMMIHKPWSIAMGSAADLRQRADLLEKVEGEIIETYHHRSLVDRGQLAQWMDQETWLTAEEAVSAGLADQVYGSLKAAACLSCDWMKNVPPGLAARQQAQLARWRIDERAPCADK